ncbi:hypothetical protein [Ekhidna sp.]|uniref:hypothetical protein n=1 Tax=Ekhidna sp. TaxID=2608089 RepID=UPI003CCC301F
MKRFLIPLILLLFFFQIKGQSLLINEYRKSGYSRVSDLSIFNLADGSKESLPIELGNEWWLSDRMIFSVIKAGIMKVSLNDQSSDTLSIEGYISAADGTSSYTIISISKTEVDSQFGNIVEKQYWNGNNVRVANYDKLILGLKMSWDEAKVAIVTEDDDSFKQLYIHDLNRGTKMILAEFSSSEYLGGKDQPILLQWTDDNKLIYSIIDEMNEEQRYYCSAQGNELKLLFSHEYDGEMSDFFYFYKDKIYKLKRSNYDYTQLLSINMKTGEREIAMSLNEGNTFSSLAGFIIR